jgi:uncharacterized protein (DUF427 family)
MSEASQHPGYSVYFDYRVDIHRRRNLVTATLGGVELARTNHVLLVDEQNHGLVFYFPRADVRLDKLAFMPERSSVCPWKGVASYWRAADGSDPIAWAYEAPHPQVIQIKDHIAFYQDRVTVALGVAPFLPNWQPPAKPEAAKTKDEVR